MDLEWNAYWKAILRMPELSKKWEMLQVSKYQRYYNILMKHGNESKFNESFKKDLIEFHNCVKTISKHTTIMQ